MAPASSDETGASSDETTLSSDEITFSSDEIAASSEHDYDDDISLPSSPSASPEPDDDPSSLLDELDTATTAFRKKSPFQRCRTCPDADDLTVMKAVAAHHEQHGRVPSGRDLSAALRGSGIQASADQLAGRVPRLRRRYEGSVLRLARGTVPEKDADVEIYRLSKRVWGGCPRTRRKPRAAPVTHPERRGFEELQGMYPCLAAEVEAVMARRPGGATAGALKRAFGRIGDEKAAALEKKARNQRLAELKVNAQRAELRKKAVDMLLEFIE